MIETTYVQRMARYNRWQNENLFQCAQRLGDAERRRERGAFFGSIHKTLNHILWGDRIWLSRLAQMPQPQGGIAQSVEQCAQWETLARERAACDAAIIGWADALDALWLASTLTWFSVSAQREMTHPAWLLVTHVFNHQTHHRGQVHCMLTQAGEKPSDTDLPLMAE
ncbi:MAG: DinB family protein [Proteobacteria bacterium]|nr:DinB family protein [Pseudomonadota bacterium]